MADLDKVSVALASFVGQVSAVHGWPILVSVVAINGSMFYARYTGPARKPDMLAENIINGTMALPVNIMAIRPDGEVSRCAILRDGGRGPTRLC